MIKVVIQDTESGNVTLYTGNNAAVFVDKDGHLQSFVTFDTTEEQAAGFLLACKRSIDNVACENPKVKEYFDTGTLIVEEG